MLAAVGTQKKRGKSRYRIHADIAEFYGINPFQLTTDQLAALAGSIRRLGAKRKREELAMRPDITLTTDGLFDLVFDETGSFELAEKEAQEHMARQLREGKTPR